MKIISVIPLKKGIPKGDLTYFTSLDVSLGNIVTVPIKNKKMLSLVTSVEELRAEKGNVKEMNFKLKKVIDDKGESIFSKNFLDAVFDTSKYFIQNKNNTLSALIPSIFLEEYDKIAKLKNEKRDEKGDAKNIRAEKLLFQYPYEDRISVYKTIIRESFAKGKSIFIVLPTELDVEKYYDQLGKGIEQFTFPFHSKISSKKNLLSYEKIMASTHPVVIIATTQYLCIPRNDIGTIILEHENSNAYRTVSRPHLDLRIFTEIYASKINARFIMADEILRYETIGRRDIDNMNPLHPLSFRIDFAGKIEILGNEEETQKKKKFQILKDESLEEINNALENKKSVFIFSLRKGLATMTMCKDCNETVSCEKCGSPLVLYSSHQGQKRVFVCNRCQMDKDGDRSCERCNSWNLVPLGIGTDTVYEEVKKLFPKIKIFKLDKESAKSSNGAKKIIKEFEENPGSVLIGTEMAFFYIKNKIPLSVIASFDSLWSIPNYKMSEKIVQIIFSIISNTTQKFIIQTKNDKDAAINAIRSLNLLSFVREELEDRKNLSYPPYKRFIKIRYLGNKEETIKVRKILEETLKEYTPEIFSGFVAKLKEKYVTNALIKIDSKNWSLPELSLNSKIDDELFNKLRNFEPTFDVLVDPEDLL